MFGVGKTKTGGTDKKGDQQGGSRPLRRRGERRVATVCVGVAPRNEGVQSGIGGGKVGVVAKLSTPNVLEGYKEMWASSVVSLGVQSALLGGDLRYSGGAGDCQTRYLKD